MCQTRLKLSRKVNECKPLNRGDDKGPRAGDGGGGGRSSRTFYTAAVAAAGGGSSGWGGGVGGMAGRVASRVPPVGAVGGRGIHSFTFKLNLSAWYGIGGARRGCVSRVKGVLGGV